MSYYEPPALHEQVRRVRPCGLTRRELQNLRKLSGRRRCHIVRSWLIDETKLAKYAEPRVKRLAWAYSEAIERCKARPRRTHSRFVFTDGCPISRLA